MGCDTLNPEFGRGPHPERGSCSSCCAGGVTTETSEAAWWRSIGELVHQHLDIGQGEVDWDVFFGTLAEVGFDGIMTSCVFAWEERAVESSRFMFEEIRRLRAEASSAG